MKNALCNERVLGWRGGQDSNLRLVLPSTHLAGEPIQPLWHLPVFNQFEGFKLPSAQQVLNKPSNIWTFYHAILSGGSGIRTHVGLHQTCFQDMHLQPLGHPSTGPRLFRSGSDFTIRLTWGDRCISFYILLILSCYTLLDCYRNRIMNFCQRQL